MDEAERSYLRCCICGKIIYGYGNNAQPYRKGLCCDECNLMYVIPYRLALVNERDNQGDI